MPPLGNLMNQSFYRRFREHLYRIKVNLIKLAFLLVVAPIIFIAKTIVEIRIAIIQGNRIGHLATEVGSLISEYEALSKSKRVYLIVISPPVANSALKEMFSRRIRIFDSNALFNFASICQDLIKRLGANIISPAERIEEKYACFNGAPCLVLSEDEIRKGYAALEVSGLKPSDWFVPFHARTNRYFEINHPDCNLEYHDYRNCSDENYLLAANHIAQLGGYSFRMGTDCEDPLEQDLNSKIIDYAAHFYSPTLDVFLCSHARFMLSNSSGLNAISLIAGVPVAAANTIPLVSIPLRKVDLFIPKKLLCKKTNRILAFAEVVERGLQSSYHTKDYIGADVETVENSPEEILDLCMDMLDSLNNIEVSQVNINRQLEFKERFVAPYAYYNNTLELGGNISWRFLIRNPGLMA